MDSISWHISSMQCTRTRRVYCTVYCMCGLRKQCRSKYQSELLISELSVTISAQWGGVEHKAHLPFPCTPDGRAATHNAERELLLLAAVHTRTCEHKYASTSVQLYSYEQTAQHRWLDRWWMSSLELIKASSCCYFDQIIVIPCELSLIIG